jgi:gamma-glutamylputrescine oxidase
MVKSIDARSYYQATANLKLECESLKGEISADVCVIGAGYTGLSAALELADAGYKVVVLKRNVSDTGFGAQWRQVCTGYSSGRQK